MNTRDKLLPCTCGGNGVTVDAEPPAKFGANGGTDTGA